MFVTLERVQDRYPEQDPRTSYNIDQILYVSPAKTTDDMCWLIGKDHKAFSLVRGSVSEVQHKLNMIDVEGVQDNG